MKNEKTKIIREYISKKDIEIIYGLELNKVNSLMKSGKLPYYKIEREVRFKTKDVDDYFKKNKHPIAEVSTESKTIAEHTTDEEIIGVLIDRLNLSQSKFPCRENAIVITKLEESLMWLNKRTSDRQKRNG